MSKKFLLFLIILSVLGIIFRGYLIVSSDFNVDEEMLALELSKISWQNVPVHFFGFGWGENVTLAYLSLPIVKLLPQVHPIIIFRFITLLFNILFIYFLYLLAKNLFNQKVAFIAVIFAIINPWSIKTATTGYNAFLLPLLYTSAIYLILFGIKNKKILSYLIAFFLLSLSFYTYASSFVYTPLILTIIILVYYKQIDKKLFGLGLITLFILSLPIFLFYLKNQFGLFNYDKFLLFSLPQLITTRFSDVSIFSLYQGYRILLSYICYHSLHFILSALIYSNGALHAYAFFYWWDVIFILFGIFLCFKNFSTKSYKFIFLWFLLAPAGSSFVTSEIVYVFTRDVVSLPMLILLSSLGFYYLIQNISPFLFKEPPS